MSSVTPPLDAVEEGRPLRRDAERNRRLILAAARQVFAQRGLTAGFEEIARVAGVGVGTVYRRFPDRADLVDALFEEEIDAVVARVEAAAADPDPWAGLRDFITWGVEAQATDRGLSQVLTAGGYGHERIARGRARIEPAVALLVERAQAAGGLRTDVSALDIAVATATLSQIGGTDRPDLRQRYVTLLLDGLAVSRGAPSPLPGIPPVDADLACLVEPARRGGPGPAEG
jgi:AcrR family transcriptional regulator